MVAPWRGKKLRVVFSCVVLVVAGCGGETGRAGEPSSTGGTSSTGGSSSMSVGGLVGDPAFGGLAKTPDGYVHRPRLVVCPDLLASEAQPSPPLAVDGGLPVPLDECAKHSDCSQHPHGSCILAYMPRSPLAPIPYLACAYGCVRDEECSSGQICLCGERIGACVPASCRTDADCGSNLCSEFTADPPSGCGGGAYEYFKCAVPGVECTTNADCDSEHRCASSHCKTSLAC